MLLKFRLGIAKFMDLKIRPWSYAHHDYSRRGDIRYFRFDGGALVYRGQRAGFFTCY